MTLYTITHVFFLVVFIGIHNSLQTTTHRSTFIHIYTIYRFAREGLNQRNGGIESAPHQKRRGEAITEGVGSVYVGMRAGTGEAGENEGRWSGQTRY